MKYIAGKSTVNLSQKEFLTQGGQGNIYVKDGVVYKIYIDPAKMIPISKIHDLSVLDQKNIVKPEQVITDSSTRSPVGFTMPFVDDTYILCQLFPKAFRDREKLSQQQVADLVKILKDMVDFVHSKQILIVDLNEQNLLVSKHFNQIYAIDVDNWQTKSSPCMAIMDNIRDPHSKTFTELTDWYSFAITSFQMFTSIHPYFGKHPTVNGWKDRMLKNISVFNKDVLVPLSAQSFDIIPSAYKDWYHAVFDDGKRIPPPSDFITTVFVNKFVKQQLSNKVVLKPYFSFNEKIINIIDVVSNNIIVSNTKFIIGKNEYTRDVNTAPLSFNYDILSVSINNGKLIILNLSKNEIVKSNFLTDRLMINENRLYIKSNDKVIEISLFSGGKQLTAVGKEVAFVLPNASNLYKGCVIQNMLGSIYCSFFPNSGKSYQVKIPELDDYKILNALFESQVLIVSGFNRKSKKYDKLVFRFDLVFKNYDCRMLNDSNNTEINFVVLDTGIVIHQLESGKVELFKNLLNNSIIKILEDSVFDDVILAKNKNELLLIKENEIFIAKML